MKSAAKGLKAAENMSIPSSKLPDSSVGEAHNVVNYAKYKEVLKTTEAANPLVDSLRTTGKLPSNYVTKAEAMANG